MTWRIYFTVLLSVLASIVGGAIAGFAITEPGFSAEAGLYGLLAALIGTYTFGTVVGTIIARNS